jgi:hydrogenase/urease accessory protein HupE
MTGRYGDIDYPSLTKRSFLVGIALVALGELGEAALGTLGQSVPTWEHTLLTGIAVLGIIVALTSPFVFGILLPLTE